MAHRGVHWHIRAHAGLQAPQPLSPHPCPKPLQPMASLHPASDSCITCHVSHGLSCSSLRLLCFLSLPLSLSYLSPLVAQSSLLTMFSLLLLSLLWTLLEAAGWALPHVYNKNFLLNHAWSCHSNVSFRVWGFFLLLTVKILTNRDSESPTC